MRYIVEKGSGNPKILKINDDNTFSVIGFAAGEANLKAIQLLVGLANNQGFITDLVED